MRACPYRCKGGECGCQSRDDQDHVGQALEHSGWRNNVFVERLWRSVKYEQVYLHAYDSVVEARASIGLYLGFYNAKRPHRSLDRRTPDDAYFNPPTPIPAAA